VCPSLDTRRFTAISVRKPKKPFAPSQGEYTTSKVESIRFDVDKNKRVYVYCACCNASATMAKRLLDINQPGPSCDLSQVDPQEPSTSSSMPKKAAVNGTRNKYLEPSNFPFCANVSKYQKLMKIGHGSFGYVCETFLKKL